jgi:hypothetical protein
MVLQFEYFEEVEIASLKTDVAITIALLVVSFQGRKENPQIEILEDQYWKRVKQELYVDQENCLK